jgi:GNAT superfamily N-acetyltransferase
MTDLPIRPARADDAAAILAVTLAAYEEYAPVMQAHWAFYRQSIIETLAHVEPANQLVAERDGLIVGSVLLVPAGTALTTPQGAAAPRPWPEIRLLAVVPAMRGHGIGAALIRACISWAGQAGATALTLHTTDIMQVAMRMYERLGFVRAPEIDFHPMPDVTIKGYRYQLDQRALAAF